jgi:hypothetical protein
MSSTDSGLNASRRLESSVGRSRAQLFQRAVAGGFFCYPAMAHDPWLDSLRGEPEFERLLAEARNRHGEAAAAFSKVQGNSMLGLAESDVARTPAGRGAAL